MTSRKPQSRGWRWSYAMLSQIDACVGGDGGWASGEVDPNEVEYPSGGGSDGDDFGADDY